VFSLVSSWREEAVAGASFSGTKKRSGWLAACANRSKTYSIFGMGVGRKHAARWLFSQEKATLHAAQKVYMYSKNA